jgi:hypothetical protein
MAEHVDMSEKILDDFMRSTHSGSGSAPSSSPPSKLDHAVQPKTAAVFLPDLTV